MNELFLIRVWASFLGSNPETSILVLKRFPEIQEAFNLQVMIAVSRKSFLGKITGTDVKSRLAPTLAAEMYAYKKVQIISAPMMLSLYQMP